MNSQKTATMLAALRYWQAMEMPRLVQEEGNEARDAAAPFRDYFEDEKPLTSEEIDSLCEEINCGSKLLSEEDKFSSFGYEISGGYISYPDDDDGTIRRVDDDGNTVEVRRCEDEGYSEWADLFKGRNSKE